MTDTTSEFNMDSKVVMAIIAMTVTTVAAIVCTKKYILDKKQPTSPEKRILRRKQRSMMKAIVNIEDDAQKMLEDIRKVQGIILDFMKQSHHDSVENNEKTIVESTVDNNDSIDTETNEKTVIDNGEVEAEAEEAEEEEETVPSEEKATTTTTTGTTTATTTTSTATNTKSGTKAQGEPTSLQEIRVDGLLMEMKLKGLDEFLLRLLEQLDTLRPNALLEEAREMCEGKEGLEDVIPYVEHKVEKIKKRKRALVVKIQNYLDHVDKLASTVSGKNQEISVVESVAELWAVDPNPTEEADDASNDDEKKNN